MKHIIILSLMFAISHTADACSCFKTSPAELINKAQIIYAGKAIKSEPNGRSIKTTFEVIETFKGHTQKQEFVISSDSSASCGINYEIGHSYVILTDEKKRVSICRGYDDYYPADTVKTSHIGILKELRKTVATSQ